MEEAPQLSTVRDAVNGQCVSMRMLPLRFVINHRGTQIPPRLARRSDESSDFRPIFFTQCFERKRRVDFQRNRAIALHSLESRAFEMLTFESRVERAGVNRSSRQRNVVKMNALREIRLNRHETFQHNPRLSSSLANLARRIALRLRVVGLASHPYRCTLPRRR